MSKTKPVTPYERLRRQAYEFARDIVYCRERLMLAFTKIEDRNATVYIHEIQQRTIAAQQLGFEAVLVASGSDLKIVYRTRRPDDIPAWMVSQ